MKELTVGMPLCNEGRYLRETLESLLRNYQYIDRIILSDNCSDDDTATICKEYEKKYDKIDYFRQEKRLGLWDSWRVPLAMTDTKYFMWLCGHDLISDNFMKEMLCQLRQNPDAVAGISMVYMFYDDITNQRIHLNPLYSLTTSPDVKQRVNAVLSNWHHSVLLNQIIRTSVLKEMPEMDQVASDQILAFYVALKGRMVYSTNAEYFYRENKREIESFTKKKSRYESWKLEYKEINSLGYLPNQFWEMCKRNIPEFSNGWLYDTISQQCRINRDADFDDDTFILRHKRGAMEKRINGLGRRNVIFGTGKEAETLYGALAGRVEICGFADNNPQRQQGSFMGLKVWAPAELKDNRENIFVLVAMGNFYREISEQLSVLGFQYWDDFCYWGEIASWHELCGVPHHDTCARFDIFD